MAFRRSREKSPQVDSWGHWFALFQYSAFAKVVAAVLSVVLALAGRLRKRYRLFQYT